MRYWGERTPSGCAVWCGQDEEREPLPLRNDLVNHSPGGAEWGYAGSGPAQLALALLAHALGDDALALSYYQAFKAKVVARLPPEGWQLTAGEVRTVVQVLSLEDRVAALRRELAQEQQRRERSRRERNHTQAALEEEEVHSRALWAALEGVKAQLRTERREHGACLECGTTLTGAAGLPEPCRACQAMQGDRSSDAAEDEEPGRVSSA
jgi:rubrerythrin